MLGFEAFSSLLRVLVPRRGSGFAPSWDSGLTPTSPSIGAIEDQSCDASGWAAGSTITTVSRRENSTVATPEATASCNIPMQSGEFLPPYKRIRGGIFIRSSGISDQRRKFKVCAVRLISRASSSYRPIARCEPRCFANPRNRNLGSAAGPRRYSKGRLGSRKGQE